MKIPNRRNVQQIAINHSSDIDFKDFMKIYKKNILQAHIVLSFALSSDNPLGFSKNLLKFLEQIYNKIMTIDDQIKDEKLQYDINRETIKIPALS